MQTKRKPTLISVVVPVYNRASLITRALDSVHDQTYRPIELIVVDDGSTDATRAVVERWRAAHEAADFSTVTISEVNSGAAAARNIGIRVATGEWIAFLDSDDWWEPEKMIICHHAIGAEPHYGFWYSSARWIDERTGAVMRTTDGGFSGNHRASLKTRNTIAAFPSVMVRREVLLAAGGLDERFPTWEDIELCYRLSEQVAFGFIPEVLVNIGTTAGNRLSSSRARGMRGRILYYKKHKHSFSVLEKLYHQKRILGCALRLKKVSVVARYGLGGFAHYVWRRSVSRRLG